MYNRPQVRFLLPLVFLVSPAWALSAQPRGLLSFDCDVPADRFSFVSQDMSGPLIIKGSVQVVEMRAGNNLPVAGARMVSADGQSSVGFQLIAASKRAKQFDVVLNIQRDGDMNRRTVAQISAQSAIPFSLSLADSGKVTFVIGSVSYEADFAPLSNASGMAFCSTAQFKFTELAFAVS